MFLKTYITYQNIIHFFFWFWGEIEPRHLFYVIHPIKWFCFKWNLSVFWNTLTKIEICSNGLEKQHSLWTCYTVPRYSSLAHLPLSWSHDRPRAAAMQLPDLFSNHIGVQGKLQPAVWNMCMCEHDFTHFQRCGGWCCGGFPHSGGNIAQSVLKYVISGPCPHTGTETHAIINSLRLISFGDGTLPSFWYWIATTILHICFWSSAEKWAVTSSIQHVKHWITDTGIQWGNFLDYNLFIKNNMKGISNPIYFNYVTYFRAKQNIRVGWHSIFPSGIDVKV